MPHIRQIPESKYPRIRVLYTFLTTLCFDPDIIIYLTVKRKKNSNKCTQLFEYKYFSKNNWQKGACATLLKTRGIFTHLKKLSKKVYNTLIQGILIRDLPDMRHLQYWNFSESRFYIRYVQNSFNYGSFPRYRPRHCTLFLQRKAGRLP